MADTHRAGPGPRIERRDFLIVSALVLLCGLFLWGKPWHMDEPFFLAIARQALRDPLHPLTFDFNWYGWEGPMSSMNNTPPVLGYLLAAALSVSGGSEFWTRALFLPFDLAAAWALLAIAARFLHKPLWPVLVVLAGPAWALNLHHVMAERVMAGFALPAIWLFLAGVDDGDRRRFWASGVLAALALMSKYNALFLLPACLFYGYSRGVPLRRLAAWTVVAVCAVAVYHAADRLQGGGAALAAWSVAREAAGGFWSSPSHLARALLAFTGGLSVGGAFWGAWLRPPRWVVLALGAGTALLFCPWLDLAPIVRPTDRLTGFLLALGTMLSLWTLGRGPHRPGAALWMPWIAAVAVLQAAYWSVLARFVVFLLPPLLFALWERLEAERPESLELLGRAGTAAALVLALGVAAVDLRYARAQKSMASETAERYLSKGRRVFCAAHWGLQEYLVAAGAREIDLRRGGWDEAKPGDVVVVTKINSNVVKPRGRRPANVYTMRLESLIPLRHMSGWTGEGAYYSSVMGFLPWSLSLEPVEEFSIVELL